MPNADLLIQNIMYFNGYLGQFKKGQVAVSGGKFLYTGPERPPGLKASRVIDGENQFLVPGLIDIHLHIESSMVTPTSFSRELIKNGVTTVVADPHEIANVFGLRGIEEMIKTRDLCQADIFYAVPSSVPTTHLETTGGSIGPEELDTLLRQQLVICLGEVMNARELLDNPGSRINQMIKLIKNKFPDIIIEGHCPDLSGLELADYIYHGVDSDHTKHTPEEIRERIAMGMFIEIQEKTMDRRLIRFLCANELYQNFCFVTDDVMADTLTQQGHLNYLIKQAIDYGMSPAMAVYTTTLTPARRMKLSDRGRIAPGKQADFLLLDDLEGFEIAATYKNGTKVFDRKSGIEGAAADNQTFPADFYQSIERDPIASGELNLKAPAELFGKSAARCRIMKIKQDTTYTEEIIGELPLSAGHLDWESSPFCLAVVLERYGQTGDIGYGLAGGTMIKRGAVATTYAHDHHNLLALGQNRQDLLQAINYLIEIQGGYVVVHRGEILASIELPVAGILSEAPVSRVGRKLRQIRQAMIQLGYRHYNPVMSLSTLSLPVSPELKLTDRGLIDTRRGEIVNLFVEG